MTLPILVIMKMRVSLGLVKTSDDDDDDDKASCLEIWS